ncbi:hypothetical protein D7217_11280 [Legionella pneumophila]|nr:hypothetical protein D7217_11280 [Legionella pneumophila]
MLLHSKGRGSVQQRAEPEIGSKGATTSESRFLYVEEVIPQKQRVNKTQFILKKNPHLLQNWL